MKVLLAVDGGGTKTEAMLTSTKGEVLSVAKYEGTNLNSVGILAATKTLERCLDDFSKLAIEHNLEFAGVYFGLAGGVNGVNQQTIYDYFKGLYFNYIPFSNAGDDLNSINVGVKSAKNGIAVIAGTGSNVMLKKDGIVLPNPQLSGWGYLFDKGASGFDFGRAAVIAAKNEYNGTGKPTLITKMLEQKLGCNVFDALGKIYNEGARFVASFGPLVFDAYRAGDEVAAEIINDQILAVANMINQGHQIIGKDEPATVGLVGGIFSHEVPIFEPALKSLISKNLTINFPQESQIYGAVMEAAKTAGIETNDEFLNNYHKTVNSPILDRPPSVYSK